MTGLPRLHVVTDDAVLARPDFISTAAELMRSGGAEVALHLRGPRTGGRRLFALAEGLIGAAVASKASLVVNDRVDVALATGIGAVHLGRRSLAPAEVRGIERRLLVGASCHDGSEIEEARAAAVDWIVMGNVFETTSHPGRRGLGVDRFEEMAQAAEGVPVIAIGGVTVERTRGLLEAGARGVAVRSGIWEARSPRSAASEYISVLQADAGGTR